MASSDLSFHHSAFNRANFLGNTISFTFYNFKTPSLQEPGLWSHEWEHGLCKESTSLANPRLESSAADLTRKEVP